MPDFKIPKVDDDGEEICGSEHQAKPGKKRREGSFIPSEALKALYSRFPGSAASKVFFLLLTQAARYGKGLACLSINEIATTTHLSTRTVKYAIARLKEQGFIYRSGRYQIKVRDLGHQLKGVIEFPEGANGLPFRKPFKRAKERGGVSPGRPTPHVRTGRRT
jgi:hypothetical protein